MHKRVIPLASGARLVLVDSITQLIADDRDAIVVTGSHGGASAAEFAVAIPLAAVFFNDAGVGRGNAGIAALAELQTHGVAAGTVSHTSARIGDALDAWENGVLSHVNRAAERAGYAVGRRLVDALQSMPERSPIYRPDLAWIHHVGYSKHAETVALGIIALLRKHGVHEGAQVLDVGCGSGLLAHELAIAGYRVQGIDASPAMIDIARRYVPGATFDVCALPAPLPGADAVVSTGHVLNYLGNRDAMRAALAAMADAVRGSGVIAFDLMTEQFAEVRSDQDIHARAERDWAIITRFSRPEPSRFDRAITTFRKDGANWRRNDEIHRNVMLDEREALAILRARGIEADVHAGFGTESLPEGLVVIVGTRRSPSSSIRALPGSGAVT